MTVKFLSSKSDKKVTCLTHDVSRDGIKISTNEALKVNSNMDIEVRIPDDPRPIEVSVEVVWAKKLKEKNAGNEYGLRFISIDPVDKFRALDFAYNNWLEDKINDFADPEEIPELKGL